MFRAIVAQYTRLGALQQTAGGPFRPLVALLQWLLGHVNFTNLEHYGGRSARSHARWFARPFPFARLAVAALGAVHPRSQWELLVLDTSFVSKSGRRTWGAGWF